MNAVFLILGGAAVAYGLIKRGKLRPSRPGEGPPGLVGHLMVPDAPARDESNVALVVGALFLLVGLLG